ncbi:Uncharacterized protein SCP_0107540 [Sparassis crispa]|uniref:Uncharacterized protein n=1 Tax=Sparassis crispa TaxID=139825 RepID=A0A401G6S7_9APHY|nr:Uncharacterized protein SCP_0107540 [Sparassis crispa]GBE77872.1 Uncharacterized protein SCP_0107540 [Sparassis crispa]
MPESVESLDSVSLVSDDSYDSDEEERMAEEEWNESLGQLQQLFALVLLPLLGKWLGRRWLHWAFARYVRLGLGTSFFLGEKVLTSSLA